MVDIVLRRPERRRGPALIGLLAALAVVVHPLPLLAAPAQLPDWGSGKGDSKPADKGKKPSELPDWDASKKDPGKKKDPEKPADGKKPAQLPDWDAAKKKDPEKPADSKKPKKPTKKKGDKTPEPEPEPEPEPAPEPEPEPPAATPEPEPPATPQVPTPEPEPPVLGPDPAPTSITTDGPDPDLVAMRNAKGLIITGAAFTGVGLGGVGVMAAGLADKGNNDRRETMIAAGAVTGLLGLSMGLAMLGQGLVDRAALRKRQSARLRAAPTLTGVMLFGRF
ncbi:MAG: hypothetical protein R3B09_11795 [Nannocystaceae bacterium]